MPRDVSLLLHRDRVVRLRLLVVKLQISPANIPQLGQQLGSLFLVRVGDTGEACQVLLVLCQNKYLYLRTSCTASGLTIAVKLDRATFQALAASRTTWSWL